MFDCHVHSEFSPDSKVCAKLGCLIAIEKGLKGIAFCDHLELDSQEPVFVKQCDFSERSKFLDLLKDEFKDKIKILKGIEVGVQSHLLKDISEIVKNNDLDFVMSSVHDFLGYEASVGGGKHRYETKDELFNAYLTAIYDAVCKFKDYDVVGHIGFARRYIPFEDKDMKYDYYKDILDMILKEVISDGKGIEVNTSGHRQNLNSPIPDYDLLKRYKELGGEILTIGSDAHNIEDIAHSFDLVKENIIKHGFNYLTYFEQRKPVFYNLKK